VSSSAEPRNPCLRRADNACARAPAALPEELLEAVFRLLDATLREWPERGALLAVRRACGAARRSLAGGEGDPG
jgi:hypothetical protein